MQGMVKVQEIAVVWSWDDGTRCVLCGSGEQEAFELQVHQNGKAVRRQPVADVLEAMTRAGPALELDCFTAKKRLARRLSSVQSELPLRISRGRRGAGSGRP
jgi:hypothetical protein